jgi:acyl-CoA thioesterase II
MGDLGVDTALEAIGDGRYRGRMSRDWEIWGPMGGYLASFALRAAGAHCGRPRPASLMGHYLGVGDFDQDIEIRCETLREARTAASVRATIVQGDRVLFESLVWGINEGLASLEHHDTEAPEVPDRADCPTIDERFAAQGETKQSPYPFWDNLDQRPTAWRADWTERATGDAPPIWHEWLRFLPRSTFADPWLDACRLLILVDLGSWPAVQGYHNQGEIMAPSIDLACEFHRIDAANEWLLLQGHAPSATEGLIGAHMQVWNESRTLLASGVSQLLCRPVPGGGLARRNAPAN